MEHTLSTTDWEKVNSLVASIGNGETIRWNSEWDVDIPPLPLSLPDNDDFAVMNYIMALVRSAAEAELDFASFRIISGERTQAECSISAQLPDDYQVKGLQEWEIRDMALWEHFKKNWRVESLLGTSQN